MSYFPGFIPVFNLNVPNGGPQMPMVMPMDAPVYSTYTGNLIGYGPMPIGLISDAPIGHRNHDKPFHVIEYNPVNKSYMMHRQQGRRN